MVIAVRNPGTTVKLRCSHTSSARASSDFLVLASGASWRSSDDAAAATSSGVAGEPRCKVVAISVAVSPRAPMYATCSAVAMLAGLRTTLPSVLSSFAHNA